MKGCRVDVVADLTGHLTDDEIEHVSRARIISRGSFVRQVSYLY
jgi:hypothetical protein